MLLDDLNASSNCNFTCSLPLKKDWATKALNL